MRLLFIIITFVIAPSLTHVDYDFHSFENFEKVRETFHRQKNLTKSLLQFREKLEKEKEVIVHFLERAPGDEVEDQNVPNNAYLNLRHSFLHTGPSLARLQDLAEENDEILKGIKVQKWPEVGMKDLHGATRGLLFIFDTYKLDYVKALNGTITGSDEARDDIFYKSMESLTASDLAMIASHAYNDAMFDTAIDILKAAIPTLPTEAEDEEMKTLVKKTVELKNILVTLNNEYLKKREYYVGKGYKVHKYLFGKNLKKLKNQNKILPKKLTVDPDYEGLSDFMFHKICGGFSVKGDFSRSLPTPAPKTKKCYFLHHDDPFLKLAPFKLEVASEAPFIMVFHEIITDEEIEWLMEYSKPRLSSTRVTDAENDFAKHEERSGKARRIVAKTVQTWIPDIKFHTHKRYDDVDDYIRYHIETNTTFDIVHPILYKLSKRLEMASRLNITKRWSTLDYQVTNYGLGGLCEPHLDPHGYIEGADLPPSRVFLKVSGDIVGTLMGWLNDCEEGGATAFNIPGAEVRLFPTRGSTAFWFSLLRSGVRDHRANHGGCPVIKGSKWIFNKWAYHFDQVNNFPCGLRKSDTIQPFTGMYK